jgi:hypothetical protein
VRRKVEDRWQVPAPRRARSGQCRAALLHAIAASRSHAACPLHAVRRRVSAAAGAARPPHAE